MSKENQNRKKDNSTKTINIVEAPDADVIIRYKYEQMKYS